MDLCSSILRILDAAGERVCSNERLMAFLGLFVVEDLETFADPENGEKCIVMPSNNGWSATPTTPPIHTVTGSI